MTPGRAPADVVRVLVVDDHPVVRSGLAALIEGAEGLVVVGEAGDGVEALAVLSRLSAEAGSRADVVLMDLRMPRLDGTATTARIRAEHPGTGESPATSSRSRSSHSWDRCLVTSPPLGPSP